MDAEKENRTALAQRIGVLLRTEDRFRSFLKFVAPDGSRPIVIAMLEDRVGELFAHIARYHPHGANVIIGSEAGRLANIVARHETSEDQQALSLTGVDCPVHVDSQVGMLLAYLLLHEGESVRCRPVESQEYEVDLELDAVPA